MEIRELYQKYLETRKVSTDTRQITPDSVFFALKGSSFDANTFAEEALKKGAKYVIIDNPQYKINGQCILVKDVLTTLQELARYHRSQLKIPVIGLTGSNGKTTSKELVSAVLSRKYITYATKGNLNNHIGVPLTILAIGEKVEIAVIELGANHLGEIAMLSSIANPTHGFITNIGKAHLGTFGGFENIIRGKSELYQHLLDHHGTVFINSSQAILANMARRFPKPVLYPAKGDYYHCELVSADPYLIIKSESGKRIQTRLMGGYNFENVAAALCIGKFFGVSEDDGLTAVAQYQPENMRSQVMMKGDNTIILDAYNANPSSMEAAIENLSRINASRKMAILGDMYELEGEAESEHTRIGQLLTNRGINEVWFCGPLMKSAFLEYPQGKFFESRDELIKGLKNHPIHNTTILVKASRGMALEKVIEFIH